MSRKKIIFSFITCLILIIWFPPLLKIDRSPYWQNSFYHQMQQNIDQLHNVFDDPHQGLRVGYSKVNITPNHRVPTAGYGGRYGAKYAFVRDSIYVRTMVLENGAQRVALVSADMLLIPPTVTAILRKELQQIGFSLDNTYLSATHSHNSIGGWGEHLAGRIVCGTYDDSLVSSIAQAIIKSIVIASRKPLPATLKWGHLPVFQAVRNRLIKEGKIDSLLRVLEVTRNDSSKLVLTSFTAHPTCLSQEDLTLSRDYPGEFVDDLEGQGYSFAMFMGGAMGSMTRRSQKQGEQCISWMAEYLTEAFFMQRNLLRPVKGTVLIMNQVPLVLREPQFKVSQNWRVDPWFFRHLYGEYPATLTVLRIGDVVMVGTPCDFSGELTSSIDDAAAQLGLNAMITSFNGGYIGYITKDENYDLDKMETRLMNWYGPGNGQYLSESMNRLIKKVVQ